MKKLITLVVIFALAWIACLGYKAFNKNPFAQQQNYIKENSKAYKEYSKTNPDVPQQDVVTLVNYGLTDLSYSEKAMEIIYAEGFDVNRIDRYLNLSDTTVLSVDRIIHYVNQDYDQIENIDYDFLEDLLSYGKYDSQQFNRYIQFNSKSGLDFELVIELVESDIDLIEREDYSNLLGFLHEKYYIKKNLKRYLDYQKNHSSLSYKEIVKRVNSNIDYYYYTQVKSADLSDGNLILCNKYSVLSRDYVPDDLVTLSSKYSSAGARLKSDAAQAFMNLSDAAAQAGWSLMAYGDNGYRSYSYQASLYNYYAGIYGVDGADECSARPGYSEHQTGLAIDVQINGDKYASDSSYKWVWDNCHKYGFIYRYQGGEEYITGYQKEQWHYRYVGVEVATYIYENDIDYEEYYAYFVCDNTITTDEFVEMFK